jgi:hypothetical protein
VPKTDYETAIIRSATFKDCIGEMAQEEEGHQGQ